MSTENSAAEPDDIFDCLIVGGGPAGLTAAIYLTRFHLSVLLVDGGESRAALIPKTHNHAGFPEGIAGAALLERMRRQALIYGTEMAPGKVTSLRRSPKAFTAHLDGLTFRAKTILLATGVVNRRPDMIDDRTHALALAGGQIRYCPICDAYEVTDRSIAVIGTGERGFGEAVFLRGFSASVTLVAPGEGHDLREQQRAELGRRGIAVADRCKEIQLVGDSIELFVGDDRLRFDTLYPALGSDIRSELAVPLGAERTRDGCLIVDTHQRTNVPGLYAAGDVVMGLDQISHAMGEGGVAATTIRNDLAEATPILR